MTSSWQLDASEREKVVSQLATSITSLAFQKGKVIDDVAAAEAAAAIEKKAYTAAGVSARTTTGDRPRHESTRAYTRKLGELLLEVVKTGSISQEQNSTTTEDSLDLTGSRDFLTTETATELLRPLLADGSKVKTVKFSTKSFGKDAAAVAAKALLNISHSLESADLSDIIAGRPEDEALEVLRILSKSLTSAKLKYLNISDNALGEKGVRACAEVLAQTALEGLSLQNVGCSIHACSAVDEILVSASSLKQLHLFNNMSDNEGALHIASILARAPSMSDFKMASSRVGPEGGIALAKSLMTGSSLLRLDISDNPMTGEIATALAKCLSQQPNLLYLNLNDTGLTDDGIITVCAALKESAPKLEDLGLALNEITPDGASAVAAMVRSKAALQRLNLRENELEDKGTVIICKALGTNTTLQVLDLCQNQIRRVGAVAAAKAVANKPSLELLALNENEISEEGVDLVKEVLTQAFGNVNALGPLDDNDPDAAGDEEEEEEEEEGEEEDALAAAMAATKLG